MQVREIDSKVAVINLEDSKKIGLSLEYQGLGTTINGSNVDIEFIDEYSNDWRLPKIYLKGQAYLSTLQHPELKRYVKLISNKFENFKRLIDFSKIEELAYSKIANFCNENNFGIDETIDEFIYGNVVEIDSSNIDQLIQSLNEKIETYNSNLNKYKSTIDSLNQNDENYEELASNALSNCKISIISIYRDFIMIENAIKNSLYQEFNHNSYNNLNCPYCHKSVDFIDKDKLIYVNGNKVYYRRPGVDPSEYTDDDVIYELTDEQIAEMFGENTNEDQDEFSEENYDDFNDDKNLTDSNLDSPYINDNLNEQVEIPNYTEYNNEIEDNYNENLDNNNDLSNNEEDYSNYNDDFEDDKVNEPKTDFEKLLFYSNDNTPIVVNFVSQTEDKIIKKSTITEYVGNEIRSQNIVLTDDDSKIISETTKTELLDGEKEDKKSSKK